MHGAEKIRVLFVVAGRQCRLSSSMNGDWVFVSDSFFLLTPFTILLLLVVAVNELKMEKGKKKDTLKLNFIPQVYNYFVVGNVLSEPR